MKKKIIIVVILLLILASFCGVVAVKVIERNKTLAVVEEVKSLVVAELVEEACGDDISVDDISIEVETVAYNSERNDYAINYKARLTGNGEYAEADEFYAQVYMIRSQIETPSGFKDIAYVDMDTKTVGLISVATCLYENYESTKEEYSSFPALVKATEDMYLEYMENKFDYDGMVEFNNEEESWEKLPEKYFGK